MRFGRRHKLTPHQREEALRRLAAGQTQADVEGIVSKRNDSIYRSGRSPDWLKMKNLDAPAAKREAEEDWGK